jgi:hypothetical protein
LLLVTDEFVGEFDLTFVGRAIATSTTSTPTTGMVVVKMMKATEELMRRLSSND